MYAGNNAGKKKPKNLGRLSISERISYRELAALDGKDLIRLGEMAGYLPRRLGTRCLLKCGTNLECRTKVSNAKPRVLKGKVGKFLFPNRPLVRYFCSSWECDGNKHGFAIEDDGKTCIGLGGRGRCSAGDGLLAVCLATQPWSGHHPSRNDVAVIQGISEQSCQLYLDETRRAMACLNKVEEASIKLTLMEASTLGIEGLEIYKGVCPLLGRW